MWDRSGTKITCDAAAGVFQLRNVRKNRMSGVSICLTYSYPRTRRLRQPGFLMPSRSFSPHRHNWITFHKTCDGTSRSCPKGRPDIRSRLCRPKKPRSSNSAVLLIRVHGVAGGPFDHPDSTIGGFWQRICAFALNSKLSLMLVRESVETRKNCKNKGAEAAPAVSPAMSANGGSSVIVFLLPMHSDPVPASSVLAPGPQSRKTFDTLSRRTRALPRLPALLWFTSGPRSRRLGIRRMAYLGASCSSGRPVCR
jgi:hypothetical protein